MAQVKVYGLRRRLEPVRAALSDAIHAADVEAFQYPGANRSHRFLHLDDADFLFPADRSDRHTTVEIGISEGRSAEARKALIRGLYARIPQATGIAPEDPEDIEITIAEAPRHARGIRGLPDGEIGLDYRGGLTGLRRVDVVHVRRNPSQGTRRWPS